MNHVATNRKATTAGMRAILYVAALLVAIAGYQLFVLTEHTATYFAWTVKPPLTAAFLGAAYWGSFVLVLAAAREREWANARAGAMSALTFTCLTTVATLLHMDRFHFDSPATITQVATWAWMLVYWIVPPVLVALALHQSRRPGDDPPRTTALPRWLRVSLGLQGALLAWFGAMLFLVPEVGAQFWPWPLSPLTARAVAAWLLGMAVAENDARRSLGPTASYAVVGALELVAVARYAFTAANAPNPTPLDWLHAGAWIYSTFMLTVFLVGALGFLVLRGTARAASAQRGMG